MDLTHEVIQETIHYETGLSFLLHNNISAGSYQTHWHNAVEIIMPIRNTYVVEVNYQQYSLAENDIIIIPSGELHAMNITGNEGQRAILQFSVETLNVIPGFISASFVYSNIWLIRPGDNPQLHETVKTLLLEIFNEQLSRKLYYEVSIMQKIIGITLHLSRMKQPAGGTENEDFSIRKKHIERFSECLDYIDHNYGEKLTLEGVAQSIGYSKYHFSRWFQEYASMTFHNYLTKVRLSKAEALLIGSEKTMMEIAMEAGFQSTNTFNRIFKKHNGRTPTEYRYMHKLRKQTAGLHESAENQEETAFLLRPAVPHGVPGFSAADAVYRGNADGTYQNPIIWADIPDPDVIRVGDVYYMTSTTMYFNPGIPVMKSLDLVHWELVNYVYDILDDGDSNALRNGMSAYGKGSWASSLRHHCGVYYVAVCAWNTEKTYIFQTKDIENGPWNRYELDGVYHDSSLLFDDDGRVYLVYGGGTIRIVELSSDASGILPGGMNKVIIESADAGGSGGLPAEGAHFYKINGKYYLFLIAWPAEGTKRRIQICYRADSVDGPYEGKVVLDDDMGYGNNGVAQGGIVDTPHGEWYAMLFQDHGAVGRIPVLVPVTWEDGFPVFGTDGKVPLAVKPVAAQHTTGCIVTSDEFYTHGLCKNYTAQNNTEYRNGYLKAKNEPATDSDKADAELSSIREAVSADGELIVNNRFEDGTSHWDCYEAADISMATDENCNSPVMFVSGRATTASGLRQLITGKVVHGGIYEAKAEVKYTSGPPGKVFNICIRNGNSWQGIRIIGSGTLRRGEWGCIRGTYTIPDDADLSETSVFIETPWADKPKRETDLMDYYVRYVCVKSKPIIKNNSAMPGENDPHTSALALPWQWNHNPDNNLWTLAERPGYLRLKSAYLCDDFLSARNTLTQRTFGSVSTAAAALETQGMKDGDTAGLAALQELCGYVGVKMVSGEKYIVMVNTASELKHKEDIHPHLLAGCCAYIPISQERVYLRTEFDFLTDTASFYYSLDELRWHIIGEPLPMQYRLSHFTGYRFALFYHATQIPGGYADFDYFRLGSLPAKNNAGFDILGTRFIHDTQALGIKGTKIRASICMDALPAGDCNGIYLSFAMPDILDIEEISFCKDNIAGDASYEIDGNQLRLCVTGRPVSFTHAISDRFADFCFSVNRNLTEDMTLTLRPDYIFCDGGNAVYSTHGTSAVINIYAPDTFTRGYPHDSVNKI